MKKVLLASTALIGLAGAAAAEVSLSGYAEIGVKGGSGMDTQFHNDIDVTFNLSSESDNGLTFGATIDLDEVNNSAEVNGLGTFNRSSVFVSGTFGKVTLGDTDGAFDWAMKELDNGMTSLTDDHSTHAGFNGNSGLDGTYNGQVMRYEYSFGDFSAAMSAELDNANSTTVSRMDPVLGLGVKWSGDFGGTAVGAGVGYQAVGGGGDDIAGISLNASMANGFGAVVNFSQRNSSTPAQDWKHSGISVNYKTGALNMGVNYGVFDFSAAGMPDADGWGAVVNYDLGGGAVAMVGYGDSLATGGNSTWSAGLGMSF